MAVKNSRMYSVGSDADTNAQVRGLLETTGFVAVDLGTLHVGGPLASLPFCALATQNFVRI